MPRAHDIAVSSTGDTKKWELLKNPTKIEEMQQKNFIDKN
jgi:hypothetical protein